MKKIQRVIPWVLMVSLGWTAFAHAEPKLLEPEQAFRVKVTQRDKATVTAHFTLADNYYLYRDRMRFAIKDAPGVAIQSVRFPEGIVKQDPDFGKTVVYKHAALVDVVLKRPATMQKVTVVVDYQGCEEKTGVCYPPMQKTFALTLKN